MKHGGIHRGARRKNGEGRKQKEGRDVGKEWVGREWKEIWGGRWDERKGGGQGGWLGVDLKLHP